MLHWNRVGPRAARTLLVDFGPRRFRALYDTASASPAVYGFDFLLAEIARDTAVGLESCDETAFLAVEAFPPLLALRLAHVLREPARGSPPEWFLGALAAVEGSTSQVARAAQLALRVGVHPATLRKAFRRYRGVSPEAFLMSVRLRRAARRLAETDAGIAVIALDEGFCDQAHLGRHFKRFFGVTPAAFRRAKRSGWRVSFQEALDSF